MIPFPYQAAGAGMIQQGSVAASGWNAAVAALPSLWGWWKLDEVAGAGVSAPDSSGNARNGVYRGSGTQTTGLFAGSSAAQATIGARVELPTYTTAATPQFSVGAFIRTTTGAVAQQILSADPQVGARVWQFRKNTSTNAIEFITIQPSVTTTTGTVAINDGNSHFVCVVFDQTLAAGSGRVKLYVDGTLDVASSTAITITGGLARPPGIGSQSGTADAGVWSGALDEAFICDTALSSTDVANLWAARNT